MQKRSWLRVPLAFAAVALNVGPYLVDRYRPWHRPPLVLAPVPEELQHTREGSVFGDLPLVLVYPTITGSPSVTETRWERMERVAETLIKRPS